MKLLFIILFFLSVQALAFEDRLDINQVRVLYEKSATDEKACKEMFVLLSSVDGEKPLLLGYKASNSMMMAKYIGNPFSKISYFRKGKQMLERAIELDGNNVELRFLRFMTQTNAPSFLGYNANIETDKTFILSNISSLKETRSKKFVTTILKRSEHLNAKEKKGID